MHSRARKELLDVVVTCRYICQYYKQCLVESVFVSRSSYSTPHALCIHEHASRCCGCVACAALLIS